MKKLFVDITFFGKDEHSLGWTLLCSISVVILWWVSSNKLHIKIGVYLAKRLRIAPTTWSLCMRYIMSYIFCMSQMRHISFLQTVHVNFKHVILKMIPWPQLEGSQFQGIQGQALLPVSAITKGSNPLSLLQKQAKGPGCPKTGCSLFLALLSFHMVEISSKSP